jgi:ribose transport system permease protein
MSQTQTKTSRISGSDRQKASKVVAWKKFIQVAGILPILVAICVIFSLVTPNFLSLGNFINVIRQASINIVLATGMTFVILTGGIDLSVGLILGVTAVSGRGAGVLSSWSGLVCCIGCVNNRSLFGIA